MITEKAEAFQRISASRVPKAIKSIQLLENLAGSNYHYSAQEALDLVGEIRSAADGLAAAFKLNGSKQQEQPAQAPKQVWGNGANPIDLEDNPGNLEQLDPRARNWVAWALDKIKHGDRSEAIEMLKLGLKIQHPR